MGNLFIQMPGVGTMVGQEIPHFCPGEELCALSFVLRPCVRLLGLSLRAVDNLPLVFPALAFGSSVVDCSLIYMLPV
jgi:hypothetical protein